jgi:hypothetical protein
MSYWLEVTILKNIGGTTMQKHMRITAQYKTMLRSSNICISFPGNVSLAE